MPELAPSTPPPAAARFPTWVLVGGLLIAAGYLPTLAAPFDFTDDGNLVYPSRGLTAAEHVELWWAKVVANVQHLGPFRPTVWIHWQVAANLFGADPLAWRAGRLVWCGLAAITLLWLMRELKLHPVAALIAAAAAMWNPYRNEIWTSLTLAEGVAMPYALFALIAARKAGRSARPWAWDVAAVVGLLVALGCKNVFVALVPVVLLLRVWSDGESLRAGVRRNWKRALIYVLPALLPVGHFIYFRTHWHAGYYETPGPSWAQATQFVLWLKGAAGADFLAAGVVGVLAALGWERWRRRSQAPVPAASAGLALPVAVGGLLFACGFLVYLPVNIMSGRYTMPAVWGVDLLLAVLLTRFVAAPASWATRLAWGGVAVGLVALVTAGVSRQEKVQARSQMLWAMLEHVERTAPPHAVITWVSGPTEAGQLNAEEGIHFWWHLIHRGRVDIRVSLVDERGNPIPRVELPPPPGPPEYRIGGHPSGDPAAWREDHRASERYRFGRREYSCVLERRVTAPPSALDPQIERLMRDAFGGYDPVQRLLGSPADDRGGVADAFGGTANPRR